MKKLKIFIFNKLADFIFYVIESDYYQKKSAGKHLFKFEYLGDDCCFHPNTSVIGGQYISIGIGFRSSWNLRLEAINQYKGQIFTPKLKIGDNVVFHTDIHIACIDQVTIGDNCLLASRIFVSDHNHGSSSYSSLEIPPRERPLTSKGPVSIEENCWIGEGVSILSGVTIGRNSIIATNSVVTKDIPEFSIAGGTPAKVIKKMIPDNI